MPAKGYTTFALPKEMTDYIDKLVEDPKIKALYGYTSRADLIRNAVTIHMRELEKVIHPKLEDAVD